ncbi:MAG: glycosyl transferase group 1 [Crocinitomicaceae bacterium]|jgi:glycosyltransferase involved in cell wall biosynthesis|nr:glycosyl transferase group 1 [Crocinitomicaceae bacterium]
MKVLIVCSGNKKDISPFIREQSLSLERLGVEIDFFPVDKGGISGYRKNIGRLKQKIALSKPDLIHAHYGLSGFLCIFQRKVPFVLSLHGSDINIPWVRAFSKIAMRFSAFNIFVSEKLLHKSGGRKGAVIPCGIDMDTFYPQDRLEARRKMNLDPHGKYILFASSFSNKDKNAPLAKEAVALLNDPEVTLLELKGYSREEVALLMNAADLALMTSPNEGSPQFIKEAMACNCPVVSTDVGDVKANIGQVEGCFITTFEAEDIKTKIGAALKVGKINGREHVERFNLGFIAGEVLNIYKKVLG